ncbi:putative transcriptional repressor NF-X1-like [Apostichopus japonicus]|uniref:Putative transcriptional repressor NF-X1-like n=1 Tax=Stichopus japonicus TaxID=307972 RepID=A0A2G8KNS8_STIJA|nr:putative transcriptional repressor NF-X1-like [Apostichopus japonicus]
MEQASDIISGQGTSSNRTSVPEDSGDSGHIVLLEKLCSTCFCGQKTVSFTCGSDDISIWGADTGFSCDVPCQKQLSCGYHNCSKMCHHGACGACPLTPENVSHCPCGKTPLAELKGNDRDKCIDPIPTCEEVCGKRLGCGGEDNPHTCQRVCHEGNCAPCNKTTLAKCACGHRYVDASCIDVLNSDKGYKLPSCDRKCTKRKHCGKHKCNRKCCTDLNHICDQVCGRKLNCGVHFCEEFCHIGDCTRCLEASFEELTCHCGAQTMEPPIPCGATPPPCDYPCARYHQCDHPVRHTCHNDSQCPPCVELTSKYCFGKHELRHNLPCHIKDISCGKPCIKPLVCGAHTCQKICHKGPCEEGGVCTQPCTVLRSDCGHPCSAPCHVGLACPMVWTYCKAKVELKCACGNLSGMVMCMSGADETQLQSLECNEMCAIIERNRRMAEALQVKDAELRPDVGAPQYSDFLKDMARKNPSVIISVEKGLSNLVHSVQDSKFATRSHQFPVMNRDSRRMIHELAEFYGCQTQSYDQDPSRNVVATARKDKSYLPNMTLSAVVQRERFPKAPMPIPHHRKMDIRSPSPSTKLYSDSENSLPDKPKKIHPKEAEDYFDWTG